MIDYGQQQKEVRRIVFPQKDIKKVINQEMVIQKR